MEHSALASRDEWLKVRLRLLPEYSELVSRSESLSGAPEFVRRAVDLIVMGALDHSTEKVLADRLGISGRHLRRLFRAYLGVTPDNLARSCRAHFARGLLDEADLTMTEIAFAVGYGSVRQFNREFQRIFHGTPSQLRADRLSYRRQPPQVQPSPSINNCRRSTSRPPPGLRAGCGDSGRAARSRRELSDGALSRRRQLSIGTGCSCWGAVPGCSHVQFLSPTPTTHCLRQFHLAGTAQCDALGKLPNWPIRLRSSLLGASALRGERLPRRPETAGSRYIVRSE
jgi:AraC-like DNA-binding protein